MPAKPATMTAAEYLAALKKPAASTSVPAAGQGSITKPKKPSTPTNALTKAILSLLRLEGCHVWRQNNAGVFDNTLQVWRAGSSTPGLSDVLGYHRATGRFVAVEVKVGADKLSPEQIQFLDEVRRAGGFACEGRSLDQVRREFNEWKTSITTSTKSL